MSTIDRLGCLRMRIGHWSRSRCGQTTSPALQYPPMTERLYAYVDESGQETEGRLFVVSVVIAGVDHDNILAQLGAIETRSRKGYQKWHRARPASRQAYIQELMNLTQFAGDIYFSTFRNSKESPLRKGSIFSINGL